MKYKVIITSNLYSVDYCQINLDYLFVFGDNQLRVGMGGQATIRHQSNSIGIATKTTPAEYFTDDKYLYNQISIDKDIMMIKKRLEEYNYKAVVFPSAGIGTGLANMQIQCPKTFLYLCERLATDFNFNNLRDLVNGNSKK